MAESLELSRGLHTLWLCLLALQPRYLKFLSMLSIVTIDPLEANHTNYSSG